MAQHSSETLLNRPVREVIADYYQLTKPGITLAVLISMLVGFVVGSAGDTNLLLMFHVLLGTYLIAGGTGAHNQFMERKLDGLMKRTEQRPLPDRRISSRNGKIFSLTLIFSGLSYLAVFVNPVAAGVSLATTLIYLAAYTPMKRISAFNIVIGAVPGALPPVGGWAAATATISDPGMWMLFGILFLWQIPHVMAIAWMCKDDYSGAGFKMLPKNDEQGTKTALYANGVILLLFPVTFALYLTGVTGLLFLILGIALGLMFLYFGIRFYFDRTKKMARTLMFASIIYLPLIWVAVFIDLLI